MSLHNSQRCRNPGKSWMGLFDTGKVLSDTTIDQQPIISLLALRFKRGGLYHDKGPSSMKRVFSIFGDGPRCAYKARDYSQSDITNVLPTTALIRTVTAVPTHANIVFRDPIVNKTTCNGETNTYQQLAGYGFIPSNALDKFGDTIGGIGNSIALDKTAWTKTKERQLCGHHLDRLVSLKAALILVESCVDAELCNTGGTLDFQLRVHKFAITLTPAPHATLANPSGPDLQFRYIDTIRFTGPDRTPCTGLDADVTGSISHGGAKFQGDGFGGGGPGGRRIRIDSEGLVLDPDGAFRASDEYGPYIYRFSPNGRMTLAIHPPEAYIPRRNGTISFSADSPPYYNPNETIISADTTTGHDNNQGFEVLTVSDDGKLLYALIQFTLDQEGGLYNPYRLNARFIEYDISNFVPRVHQGISGNATALYSSGQKKKQDKSRDKKRNPFPHAPPTSSLLSRDPGTGHGQSLLVVIVVPATPTSLTYPTPPDIKSPLNDASAGSIAQQQHRCPRLGHHRPC
ncbi:hypothetical protein MMC06_002287 [Schaereria dolodes]|nr:hypothetical protein [Schaereria dolodes]